MVYHRALKSQAGDAKNKNPILLVSKEHDPVLIQE